MTETMGLHDLADHVPDGDDEVCAISFRLLELGTLDQIEARSSPEAFATHVAVQVIGIYQSDGPWGLTDNACLAPYIPAAMRTIGRDDVADAAQRWLESFPAGVVFAEDPRSQTQEALEVSEAIVSFLANPRRNLSRQGFSTEALNQIDDRFSPEERQRLSEQHTQATDALGDLLDDLDFDAVGEYVRRAW